MVEIKCPNTATMIDQLLSETVPAKYYTQIQMQLACTGRDWCDYVVFDPRMPEKAQMCIKRVDRDAEFISNMETEIVKFLDELNKKVIKLTQIIESK
jgi:predicted phage-related endonuclease